jgi:hypothetical protein
METSVTTHLRNTPPTNIIWKIHKETDHYCHSEHQQGRGRAQVVEGLPGQHEGMSSNTNTATKKTRDPRWRLEGGRRQCELCKSKMFLRRWSHTWQKKTTKNNQNSDTLNPQPIQSFSTPHYIEKRGGLLCCQMLAPNLLGRHTPTGEQISSM